MNTVIYSPDVWERVNILSVIDLLQSQNVEKILLLLDDSDTENYWGFSYLWEQLSKEVAIYCLNENEEVHRAVLYLSSICTIDLLSGENDMRNFVEMIHMLKVLSCYLAISLNSENINLSVNRYQEYLKVYEYILSWIQKQSKVIPCMSNASNYLWPYELYNVTSQKDMSFKKQLNKIPSTQEWSRALRDLLNFLNLWINENSSPIDFEWKTWLLRAEITKKLQLVFENQESIKMWNIDFSVFHQVMYNW